MLTYEKLRGSRGRGFESIVGMRRTDFEGLLPAYEQAEKEKKRERGKEKRRKRGEGGGSKPVMGEASDRLVFILFYFRHYPTQDLMGLMYGSTQPWANKWVKALTPLLEAALDKKQELPKRTIRNWEALMERCPELRLIIDGAERPVPRPKDEEKRTTRYSGKKKRHTVKNTIVTRQATKKILILGPTEDGRIHDKKLLERHPLDFPPGTVLYQDTGYQGHDPPGVHIRQPRKKKRGQPRSLHDKHFNQEVSSIRVSVEHAIGGAKHFRIVHDIFRNRRTNSEDSAMLIACGLYNHRLQGRLPSPP